MTILLADQLSDTCIAELESDGHDVQVKPGLKGADFVDAARAADPQVLVVRSTKVPPEAMDAAPRLELIVRAGAGYDNIDVRAASARGIFVANCPGKNAAAVAELALGLILALDRRIPDNVIDARAGAWNKSLYSKGEGLKGKTLGIIGAGHIGREVAVRARSFGMNIVAWSRSLTDEAAAEIGARRMPDPLSVAKEADVVTLHVASSPETHHLVDRAFLETMKPGAYLVNTSRSSVVDETALLDAIQTRGIRVAADVIEGEPSGKKDTFDHPLVKQPGFYLTHHIGASTAQAQEEIADEAVRIIQAYVATGNVPNCVNMEEHSPATHLLTVRHLDKVGVLAGVLDEMRKAGWNVQEMENLIFEGAEAACARIRFAGAPKPGVADRIAGLPDVLAASVIPLAS